MADAGEVKAKVTIEYDGSGIKQAKEDLASLAESAGRVGESAGKASEGLTGLDEQMVSNAESARGFSSVLSELPKIAEGGTSTISEMTGMLSEHRDAIEETGTAYESFSENVQKASKSLRDGAESANLQNANLNTVAQMWNDPAPFEMLQQHLQTTGQSWADFSTSVGEDRVAQIEALRSLSEGSYPLLNTISSNVEATGTTFAKSAENMQVFTEATGNSSKNLSEMAAKTYDADQAVSEFLGNRKGFSAFADQAQTADQAVAEFLGKTKAGINEFGGVGEALYGPMEGIKPVSLGGAFSEVMGGVGNMLNEIAMPLMAAQMIGMAVQQVGQAMYDSAAIAEGPAAHSFGTFTGTVDALGQSLQHATGQFSEGFGKALLPTLNALNDQASSGDLGGLGQFFGGLGSTIANLSLITTGVDPLGGMHGLINQGAALLGLQQPFQGPGPVSQSEIQYQQQMAALPQTVQQNARQLQYQANLTMADATNPEWLAQNNENMASQRAAAYLIQDYNIRHPIPQSQVIANARYNAYAAQQEQNYQEQMAQDGGGYGPVDFGGFWGGVFANNNSGSNASSNRYGSRAPGQMATGGGWQGSGGGGFDIGGFFSGIGKSLSDIWTAPNGGADTLGMLFSPQAWGFGQAAAPQTFTGGCFVAGTPVLMADGTSKPIEALRVDEQVLAHDGTKQVPATIIGCISFPAKQTYELTFSDGKTLTTTDSHPLAGADGWKSISPASTAQENPGLPVTALQVGDEIYTADGTLCRLLSIETHEITTVYNITVDTVHTYYAAGILVHNAKQGNIGSQVGQQASEQIGDIQLPHIDLSGMAAQLGGSFSGIQLPHLDMSGIASGLGSAFSGISLPHIDMSGIAGGLASAFTGISMPPIPDIGSQISGALGSMFTGISMPAIPDIGGQISGALGGMFGGISMPSIPDIGGMISGAMTGMFGAITVPSPPEVGAMISGAMSGMFGGIDVPSPPEVGAMINGAMSGMFGGIQVPTPPDVGAMINGAMSGMFGGISVPSVPFFASGVSNFAGGAAVVGEAGMEVTEYNGRYALFDQGATFVNLPAGANVYPMQDMNSYSSPRMMAQGTGSGGFSPLSVGGGMPQSINVNVHLDSQAILSAIGMPFAQDIRVATGNRSY